MDRRLDQERLLGRTQDVTPRASQDDHDAKLQQAMRTRQELLDRIRQEKNLRDELNRPASYREYRPKSRHRQSPRRAESMPPPLSHYDHSTPRQVIEHQIRPARLDPLPQAPAPPPQVVQAPTPQFVMGSHPPHQPPSTKAEMMEMMMLQNAQMHQMIMNQMMIQALPKPADQRTSTRVDNLEDILTRRRPPSVHHHHYDQTRQPSQPVYALPPPVHWPPVPYQSPRYYPQELEPLHPPKAFSVVERPKTVEQKPSSPKTKEARTSPRPPTPVQPPKPVKKVYDPLPYPGPWPLRRFRHAAYAVFFEKVLLKLLKQKKKRMPEPVKQLLTPEFLFGIKLKEIVAAIHAIYLSPTNKVGSVLRQFTEEASRDLMESFSSTDKKEKDGAAEDMGFILENVSYDVADIMPPTGSIGTHGKAHIVDMCRNGKTFPRGYLFQIEKELMDTDADGKTRNLEAFQRFMLVTGIFIARSIITTLCFKPYDYGLTKTEPGVKAQKNLKLIATVFLYVYRKILVPPKSEPLKLPYEVSRFVYSDAEMKDIFKKVSKGIDYAENMLRNWGKEYINRITPVL